MSRSFLAVLVLGVLSCTPGNGTAPLEHEPDHPGAEASARVFPPSGEAEPERPGQGTPDEVPRIDRRSRQTLYVPVYSHVYWGPDKRPFNLACTLSVRNTDTRLPMRLTSVEYYDTAGRFVRSYLDQALMIPPLGTKDFYLEERDTSGGSGANFLVRWDADPPVNVPVVEALMIGVYSSQGISFVCSAHEIAE